MKKQKKNKPELNEENKIQLLEILLHIADIGNALKNRKLCFEWAKRIVDESRQQGDREIEIFGQVLQTTPMFKRSTPLQQSQIGWCEYIILPFIKKWSILNPECKFMVIQAENNLNFWKNYKEGEIVNA